jgi:hypothetical protein
MNDCHEKIPILRDHAAQAIAHARSMPWAIGFAMQVDGPQWNELSTLTLDQTPISTVEERGN